MGNTLHDLTKSQDLYPIGRQYVASRNSYNAQQYSYTPEADNYQVDKYQEEDAPKDINTFEQFAKEYHETTITVNLFL